MGRPRLYSREEASRQRRFAKCRSREKVLHTVAAAKLARGCARCGYVEHPDALQFDHVTPLGVATRSRPRAERVDSLTSLWRALDDPNIQVLCGNCHNIKSLEERRRPCRS